MPFHGGRAEQLASFIREQILRKELSNPLPSSRVWCRQLNVGRPNLLRALHILEHAGLVTITANGAAIVPFKADAKSHPLSHSRLARFLFLGRNYPELQHDTKWLFTLSEGMQNSGIRLSLERCGSMRLGTIASQRPHRDELCFLHSLPGSYQRLFMDRKRPAVVIGYTGENITLPFLTPDLEGSTRHATLRLLRRGLKHIVLINLANREAGITKSIESFKAACTQWPHQPVRADVVRVWNDITSLRSTMEKLAVKMKEPCGFIVFSPVSVGILATALLQRGISIPEKAEIVAIEHCPDEISLSVPITLYGFPTRRFAKAILDSADHYFETGKVPVVDKTLDLDGPKEY